jgi:hypothetical protein
MASPRHARSSREWRAPELGRAWLASLAVAAAWAGGCGRIGFDPTADDAGRAADAAVDGPASSRPRDAASDGLAEASSDGSTEATPDTADVQTADVADAQLGDATDAACTVSTVADYCAALPPLPAAPIIDGVLDCGPALVAIAPVDWNGPPPLPPFPDGNSAELAAAWRPDGLYVFMNVTTPAAFPAEATDPVFYGAGVEVFVDDDGVYASAPTYDDPGAIQLVVAAPPDATTTGRRAEGFRNAADEGPWASTQFGTFPSPTGFVFEGFVAAADLGLASWTLAAGDAVGFDVSVDVSFTTAAMTGPQGHRVGQYFLHVEAPVGDAATITTPYQDPRAFCTPTLASQ